MAFVQKYLVLFFIITIIAMLETTDAQPMVDYACKLNSELDTTCQKCAKVTKSNIVYPMCCENDEHVYDWCVSYIAYGRHE